MLGAWLLCIILIPVAAMAYKIVELLLLFILGPFIHDGDTLNKVIPPLAAGIVAAGMYLIDSYTALYPYGQPFS